MRRQLPTTSHSRPRWALVLASALALSLTCAVCFADDRVTVIIDGQRIVILNGEEIIRKHGEQRGMDIIYDRAKMLLKLGANEGRIIED